MKRKYECPQTRAYELRMENGFLQSTGNPGDVNLPMFDENEEDW